MARCQMGPSQNGHFDSVSKVKTSQGKVKQSGGKKHHQSQNDPSVKKTLCQNSHNQLLCS